MANELQYIDPDLSATAGVTMSAEIFSMTTNQAKKTVSLRKVAGGFIGDFPLDAQPDIYAVRFKSNDGQVDVFDQIRTSLTPQEDRVELVIDLAGADEMRVGNIYRKFKRGTTQQLIPQKTRIQNGETVEIRQ